MIPLKVLIKVPLVLGENFLFLLFPAFRPLVEKYFYNPLDFKKEHITYSQEKFQEFCKYMPTHLLQGKILLELGPGGSLGFGLLALEKGLSKYIAIDDGIHTFISENQLACYKALLQTTDSSLLPYFQNTHQGWQYHPEKIQSLAIDQTSRYPLPDASVDIIYSCAVLEHVHELHLCFSEMSRVLKSGGIMYHEVDLRDHIFSQKSLWFLTLSNFWFYTLFSKTGSYVNRKRISAYKQLASQHRLQVVETIIKERYTSPSFPQRLSALSDEDRETLVCIMTLQKE